MSEPTLFDWGTIAQHAEPGQVPETSRVHTSNGHIVLLAGDTADRMPAFIDLGPVLRLWSWAGAELTPAMAVDLGRALTEWGERHVDTEAGA